MKADLNKFNEKNKDKNITLYIYEGKELMYPSLAITSTTILDTALSQDDSHMFVMDNIALYKQSVG